MTRPERLEWSKYYAANCPWRSALIDMSSHLALGYLPGDLPADQRAFLCLLTRDLATFGETYGSSLHILDRLYIDPHSLRVSISPTLAVTIATMPPDWTALSADRRADLLAARPLVVDGIWAATCVPVLDAPSIIRGRSLMHSTVSMYDMGAETYVFIDYAISSIRREVAKMAYRLMGVSLSWATEPSGIEENLGLCMINLPQAQDATSLWDVV